MTPEGEMLHALFEAILTHDAGRPDLIHHFAKVYAFAKHIGEAEELDMRTQFTWRLRLSRMTSASCPPKSGTAIPPAAIRRSSAPMSPGPC